jgi:hypothetical protein
MGFILPFLLARNCRFVELNYHQTIDSHLIAHRVVGGVSF